MKRARGCQRSYCDCSFLPICSRLFCGGMLNGSIHAWSFAHGGMRMTSGGSTPMFRHSAMATATVLSRSFILHLLTSPAPGCTSSGSKSDSMCRSSQKKTLPSASEPPFSRPTTPRTAPPAPAPSTPPPLRPRARPS